MSTILRGYASAENHSLLQSSELNFGVTIPKKDGVDFIIDITDKDFQDFNGQITGTIAFPSNNLSQLNDLRKKASILYWGIDYGYNTKVATGELAVEGLHFPLKLLRLCADLQIELQVSLYDGKLFERI